MTAAAARARAMGDRVIARLAGDATITLRSRAVARDQVAGLAVSTLAVSGGHAAGAVAIVVSCRALDGELPAGTSLRVLATGAVYTLFQAVRLQPPTSTLPLVETLLDPLADAQELEIASSYSDTSVPAIRGDDPNAETEAGVIVGQSVYQVSTSALPFRIDATWLVVDNGVARRVSQVKPVYAGREVVRWRIFCEGAG